MRRFLACFGCSLFLLITIFLGTSYSGLFGPDYTDLIVDLKTDFLPETEFTKIRTSIDRLNIRDKEVNSSSETLEGIRIAEFRLEQKKVYRVKVELFQADGTVLTGGTKNTIVDLGQNPMGIIVLIARPIPPPEEEPENTQVLQGGVNIALDRGFVFEAAPGIVVPIDEEAPAARIPDGDRPPDPATGESGRGDPPAETEISGDPAKVDEVDAVIAFLDPTRGQGTPSSSDAGQQFEDQNTQSGNSNALSGSGCSIQQKGNQLGLDFAFILAGILMSLPFWKVFKVSRH